MGLRRTWFVRATAGVETAQSLSGPQMASCVGVMVAACCDRVRLSEVTPVIVMSGLVLLCHHRR